MNKLELLRYEYQKENRSQTLFIFDTNFLLLPFRLWSKGDEIINLIKDNISTEQIFIPYIILLEFHRNIDYVIEKVSNSLQGIKKLDGKAYELNVDDFTNDLKIKL
ncbi:uncharacterized protein SRT_05450 [Streptococcus troglodytae]|uniref:PIN like domain-containing protein n=1 Tax=Streptococcus troglodytae TaxID=1111760 RepID=A0A1L7LI04_9STRE|nr:hypothetical protein [Streptococcus troglodytae]BAQ23806.1 uncharacterized protein SRT_05450 [Streptococcus troglodytae]